MRLRTDDDIYRARLVYLGPPGYTLPIQLSYAQYGVFVVLVPLFMFVHYLFTLHFDLFPAWEIALAIVATSFIFRHVDPDRPARMVIRTALTDWRTAREPINEQREARLVASKVLVRDALVGGSKIRRVRRKADTIRSSRPRGRHGDTARRPATAAPAERASEHVVSPTPPRSREPDDPSDIDGVEISTVPQGAVAVFQAPRPLATRAASSDAHVSAATGAYCAGTRLGRDLVALPRPGQHR